MVVHGVVDGLKTAIDLLPGCRGGVGFAEARLRDEATHFATRPGSAEEVAEVPQPVGDAAQAGRPGAPSNRELGNGSSADRQRHLVGARAERVGRRFAHRAQVEEQVAGVHDEEAHARQHRILNTNLHVHHLHTDIDAARGKGVGERRAGAREHFADVAARVDVGRIGDRRIELVRIRRKMRDRPRLQPVDFVLRVDGPLEVERATLRRFGREGRGQQVAPYGFAPERGWSAPARPNGKNLR